MKPAIGASLCAIPLSGCLAGNMARGISLKGKPIAVAEQDYGHPDTKEVVAGDSRYTWNAGSDRPPCTVMVETNSSERITDIKMVGANEACYHFRR